ncbi:uncharacterized protein L203_104881 [Cryptococcus depauperatus CBS 7841]|uniref:nicotinamidase n=1 Tax=Cryptococcus depauperatus CBS 7841 TaxID=1295531 RepID=A0AAJ8JWE0_9TREE
MNKTALIIVDVQNDFLPPNGSLAVSDGQAVLPVINKLLDPFWDWTVVVASQDYHPRGHISFASTHPPHSPFSQLPLVNAYGESYIQTLWPDHCIQGKSGSEIEAGLAEALTRHGNVKVVCKGVHHQLEAYSAFQGIMLATPFPPIEPSVNQKEPEIVPPKSSELAEYLTQKGIEKVVIVGLATDFCVLQTALSSLSCSFSTLLLAPGMRAISSKDERKAFDTVEKLGGVVLGRDGKEWEQDLFEWTHNVVCRLDTKRQEP